ncbi:hypothetical protein LINGRAHAP2_LOCUS35059 [Linum grandiflorum]
MMRQLKRLNGYSKRSKHVWRAGCPKPFLPIRLLQLQQVSGKS